MLFLLIAAYLLVTGFAMWLLLFPSGRVLTLRFCTPGLLACDPVGNAGTEEAMR